MDRFPCSLDPAKLLPCLDGAKWKTDGTGILMANGQWRGVPLWIMGEIDPYLQELSVYIGPRTLCHVMVNVLVPGGKSGVHVDPSPDGVHFERWHLPLVTNPDAVFWQDGMAAAEHLELGWWHGPVEYWKPHFVRNESNDQARTHLVIDVLP